MPFRRAEIWLSQKDKANSVMGGPMSGSVFLKTKHRKFVIRDSNLRTINRSRLGVRVPDATVSVRACAIHYDIRRQFTLGRNGRKKKKGGGGKRI